MELDILKKYINRYYILNHLLIMCKTMVMKMSLATMLLMLISMNSFSQNIGLKSNLLYWATTTPNIGLETSVGKKHTAQVFVGFNPWKQSGGNQSSLRHWLVSLLIMIVLNRHCLRLQVLMIIKVRIHQHGTSAVMVSFIRI